MKHTSEGRYPDNRVVTPTGLEGCSEHTSVEELDGEKVWAWKTDKVCEVICDHTPQWCGDCYACSECAMKFVPITTLTQYTNKRVEGAYRNVLDNIISDDVEGLAAEGLRNEIIFRIWSFPINCPKWLFKLIMYFEKH